MRVELDKVVTVQYTLSVKDGETPPELHRTFTTSFLYGRERVLPVLEKALYGREEAESFEVEIPPQQAYGEYDPSLVSEISKEDLSYPSRLKEGEVYLEYRPDGSPLRFIVKEIKEDSVVADFNHPAAGKTLLLSAKVDEVREATAADILALMNRNTGGG